MLRETGQSGWRLLRALRPAQLAVLAGIVLAAAAAAVTMGLFLPGLVRWLASVPAAVALAAAAGVWHQVRTVITGWPKKAWDTAMRMGEVQQQRLQTARDVAAAEAAALEREMQDLTAAGQLAGMVTDRAASGDYRSRLGVMTQIREDFARMAALLARAAAPPASGPGADGGEQAAGTDPAGPFSAKDAAGDALPRIDRIILYIDDLDRCPPRRVVEMLEAIHLLLAVPLFVVVVAVDPRWLLRAITAHYRDLLQAPATTASPAREAGQVDPDDEELWNSTPAQYLEKIFQVVLTLADEAYQAGDCSFLRARSSHEGRSGQRETHPARTIGLLPAPRPEPGVGPKTPAKRRAADRGACLRAVMSHHDVSMTDSLEGYVAGPGAGVGGDDPGLKASSRSTGGALSIFETSVEAGPPLHVHDHERPATAGPKG